MEKQVKLGTVMKKVLLLLESGLVLALTRRPDKYFKIIRGINKEWKKINEKSLHQAIKNLYRSKMIGYKENADGMVFLTLNNQGKKRALRYNLDKIQIKKPSRWDGVWRLVIFDIPENKKPARDVLSSKLKQMGLYPVQKSVFIYPYDCRSEIDFLVEILDLKPFVRFLIVKETDIDLKLKHHFNLI